MNEDGSTTLKPGETVKGTKKRENVTNKDGEITITGDSGNETTVTLPGGETDIEIDSDGNVIIPGGSKVTTKDGAGFTAEDDAIVGANGSVTFPDGGDIKVGGTAVTVPEGGTVTPNADGSVTVPKNSVVKGTPDTTLPDGGVIDKDGNIILPDGGTAKVGDTTVDVPAGETLEPIGDSLVKVPAGSTVNGDVLNDDGILDENGNIFEGAVRIGDVLFIPPEGEAVTDNDDETVTVPEGTVIVPGNGTDYTVECEGGKVDSSDGSVTLPEGGNIKLGNTEITTPDGGTLTPNDDGTVTVPDGSVVTPPSGKPDITITDGKDKAAVDSDGKVTFPEGGQVNIGDTAVTVPKGGAVTPNSDGTVTVPDGSTVTPPNGAPEITITDVKDKAAVDSDGKVTFPEGGQVNIGNTTVTVPEGGTIEPRKDGKVLLPEDAAVTKDGKTSTVPEGGAVYDPETGKSDGDNSNADDGSDDNSGNSSGNLTPPPFADTTDPSYGGNNDASKDDPSDGDNTNTPEGITADKVNIGTVSGENAPKVTIGEESLNKLKEEVIAEHLTDEEKAAVENGATLDVFLSIEVVEGELSAANKQAAEAFLANSVYAVGIHLNIELIKLINGQPTGKITEINTPISVTVEVPEELRSVNRVFAVVRVHNNEAEILKDTDNDPDTITIVTDKFSTYAIVYKNAEAPGNPDTGIKTPNTVIALASAVIAAAVAVKKKKKDRITFSRLWVFRKRLCFSITSAVLGAPNSPRSVVVFLSAGSRCICLF